MSEKYLIVVDMQNDFVTGSLGTEEAKAIVDRAAKKIRSFEGKVIFTRDTHGENYLSTQEGKNLPVEHCIKGTEGWHIIPQLESLRKEKDCPTYEKPTFGCIALAEDLCRENKETPIESIELIGLCTDICVVSNALLIKACIPEVPVYVDSSCCAGVTPKQHLAALETMKSCQIQIL